MPTRPRRDDGSRCRERYSHLKGRRPPTIRDVRRTRKVIFSSAHFSAATSATQHSPGHLSPTATSCAPRRFLVRCAAAAVLPERACPRAVLQARFLKQLERLHHDDWEELLAREAWGDEKQRDVFGRPLVPAVRRIQVAGRQATDAVGLPRPTGRDRVDRAVRVLGRVRRDHPRVTEPQAPSRPGPRSATALPRPATSATEIGQPTWRS